MELRVQHIAYVVENIDAYMEKMSKIFGEVKEVGNGRLRLPEAGQTSALVNFAGMNYELMEPIGTEGVVPKFLATKGQGFHHIGVYCDDIMGLAERFKAAGMRVLGDPTTGGFFSSPKETVGILYEFSNIDDLKRDI